METLKKIFLCCLASSYNVFFMFMCFFNFSNIVFNEKSKDKNSKISLTRVSIEKILSPITYLGMPEILKIILYV